MRFDPWADNENDPEAMIAVANLRAWRLVWRGLLHGLGVNPGEPTMPPKAGPYHLTPGAREAIRSTMHDFRRGNLHDPAGAVVTDPAQARAIALSRARAAGARIPEPRGG